MGDAIKKFPPDIFQSLPMRLAECAAKLALDHGLERQLRSKFYAGYLIGYASELGAIDEAYGAAVRDLLFAKTFGEKTGNALFDAARHLCEGGERQVVEGMRQGEIDGRTFLASATNGILDYATDALAVAFEMKRIDQSAVIDLD